VTIHKSGFQKVGGMDGRFKSGNEDFKSLRLSVKGHLWMEFIAGVGKVPKSFRMGKYRGRITIGRDCPLKNTSVIKQVKKLSPSTEKK